jgi:tetratricopeptide (TPR) repeat protein
MKTGRDSRAVLTGKNLLIMIGIFCLLLVSVISFAAADQETAIQTPATEANQAPTEKSAQNPLEVEIEQARQRIKDNPTSLKDQVALGYLFLKQNSLTEAEKVFDDILAVNSSYHEALTGKGIVLARTGKDKEAEEILQKALILNPNPVRTHYELGLLYEKRGDFAQANAEYNKGIEKFKQGRK